ncbi:MAG: hypothetical protein Q8O99_04340 [bacterium]|nr:hypothetical protein [bacterium]
MAQSYLLKYNLDEKSTTDLVRAINQAIAEQLGATQDNEGRAILFKDHVTEKAGDSTMTDDTGVAEAAPTIIDHDAIREKKMEVCLEKAAIAYAFLHDMYGLNCTLCFDRDYHCEAHAYVEIDADEGIQHFHANSPSIDNQTGFFKPNVHPASAT